MGKPQWAPVDPSTDWRSAPSKRRSRTSAGLLSFATQHQAHLPPHFRHIIRFRLDQRRVVHQPRKKGRRDHLNPASREVRETRMNPSDAGEILARFRFILRNAILPFQQGRISYRFACVSNTWSESWHSMDMRVGWRNGFRDGDDTDSTFTVIIHSIGPTAP